MHFKIQDGPLIRNLKNLLRIMIIMEMRQLNQTLVLFIKIQIMRWKVNPFWFLLLELNIVHQFSEKIIRLKIKKDKNMGNVNKINKIL